VIGAETEPASPSLVGTECELLVGPIAHGGHCVARWAGRVVFVRHSLPGERVLVRITEGDESSRFLRGDAIDVLDAASGRVQPPCPYSGPGRCGGCDFQHVAPSGQRELLGDVVAEQLQRALHSRVAIEQAKGMLAQGHGTSLDQAFAHLRGYARRYRLPLTGVAEDLVAGTLDLDAVGGLAVVPQRA